MLKQSAKEENLNGASLPKVQDNLLSEIAGSTTPHGGWVRETKFDPKICNR